MNITLDEIRSKAPEGATHYTYDVDEYKYLKNDECWYVFKWGAWLKIPDHWVEKIINDDLRKPL